MNTRALSLAAGLFLLAMYRSSAAAQPVPDVDPTPCSLFTMAEGEGLLSTPLRVDLRTSSLTAFGESNRDIVGLAVHSSTSVLYAMTGKHDIEPGSILAVDVVDGSFVPVMRTSLRDPRGFAVHPDGSWWTFEPHHGLVRIDPATGDLRRAGRRRHHAPPLAGLAWDEEGARLFGVKGWSLFLVDSGSGSMREITRHLPFEAAAVTVRADGLLLVLAEKLGRDDTLRLALVDPESGALRATFEQPAAELSLPHGGHGHHGHHGRGFGHHDHDGHHGCDHDHHGGAHEPRFAGLAWNTRCGNPSPGGQADLIESVVADRTTLCRGDTLHVSVETTHPDSDAIPVGVLIDGQPGSARFLQAVVPGPFDWGVSVVAYTADGYVDQERLVVQIEECAGTGPRPMLVTTINRFHDHTVDFQVTNHHELGSNLTYTWEFGDGQTATTTVPYVAHSFEGSIDPATELLMFDTSVTVASQTARKTIALWNRYAFMRSRGHVQPIVSSYRDLFQFGGRYYGSYSIRNVEAEPLHLTSRVLRGQPCDGSGSPVPLRTDAVDVVIAPGTVESGLLSEAGPLPAGLCGVELHLLGTSHDGLPVTASAYFEASAPVAAQPVTNPHLLEVVSLILEEGWSDDPDEVTEEELDRLIREGRVPPILLDPTPGDGATAFGATQKDVDPVEGARCIPGEAPRDGFVCEATDELDLVPTYIANAFRGDSILSGGCGIISEILSQVTPPQIFTHTGMMTQNYSELRSSTGSIDWLYDQTRGAVGVPGLQEDKLRYLWPGTVTQTVHMAYNGQSMLYGTKAYNIRPFNHSGESCNREGLVSFPSVVRPDPRYDLAVRPSLQAAADSFEAREGHYRFYGYSDGAIASDASFDAPEGTHYGAGTAATVCSSDVWAAMNDVGIFLEGELEPEEVAREGLDLPPPELEQPDGIYLYRRDERLAAGAHLWDVVRNAVKERDGLSGTVFGTPGRVADQVVNCFAADICEQETVPVGDPPVYLQVWQATGDGTAVSPDDVLLWDDPTQGGVYGYSEPMAYRQGRIRRVYRWVPSAEGTGTVRGTVLLGGAPVADASVAIDDQRTFTQADGTFELTGVLVGTREVRATFSDLAGDQNFEGGVLVEVEAGGVHEVTIELRVPDESFRMIVVSGRVEIRDDEVRDDVVEEFFPYHEFHVDPGAPTESWRWQECVGGEVVVRMDFNVELAADLSADVRLVSNMWERRKCKTKDLADSEVSTVHVNVGASEPIDQTLDNDEDTLGGDRAVIELTVLNRTER